MFQVGQTVRIAKLDPDADNSGFGGDNPEGRIGVVDGVFTFPDLVGVRCGEDSYCVFPGEIEEI